MKRAERRKLRYIITPEGISLRAKLTVAYVENSMHVYRESRRQAQEALKSARQHGFNTIVIDGDGDIADVARLTCLEQGFEVVANSQDGTAGILEIRGQRVQLREAVPE